MQKVGAAGGRAVVGSAMGKQILCTSERTLAGSSVDAPHRTNCSSVKRLPGWGLIPYYFQTRREELVGGILSSFSTALYPEPASSSRGRRRFFPISVVCEKLLRDGKLPFNGAANVTAPEQMQQGFLSLLCRLWAARLCELKVSFVVLGSFISDFQV